MRFAAFGLLVCNFLSYTNLSSYLISSGFQQKEVIGEIHAKNISDINYATAIYTYESYVQKTATAKNNSEKKNVIANSTQEKYAQNTVDDIIENDNITKFTMKMVNADLVVTLSGELGNNLLKIASGKIIQLKALEDGRFNFTLRYLSQGLSKSDKARNEVHKCFSRHFSPDKVNLNEWALDTEKWNEIVQSQSSIVESYYTDWDEPNRASRLLNIETMTDESIQSFLDHLEDVTNRMYSSAENPFSYQNESFFQDDKGKQNVKNHNSLSLPFVIAHVFPPISFLDDYWDDLSELFTFNETACCRERPDVDETVLHIRGFTNELGGLVDALGFRELNPKQTAYQFLGHLQSGDKVAIIGRPSATDLQHFTQALRDRDLQVRFVKGHSSPEDFCFLKTATKEIAGGEKSTFFRVAALLSDTVKNVTLFCYDYPPANVCDRNTTTPFSNKKLAKKTFVKKIFEFDPWSDDEKQYVRIDNSRNFHIN